MTNPTLASNTANGRVYHDNLPPCPILDTLGYQHTPDEDYPSVTAVLSGGVPKNALVPWAAKAVAECAYELEGHFREVGIREAVEDLNIKRLAKAWPNGEVGPVITADDLTENQISYYTLRYLKAAPDRIRDRAANRGSSVHEIVEHLAAGQTVPTLGDDLEPWIRSARQFVAEFRPAVIWSETTVFNRQFGYAGTLDLIADLPGHGRYLIDYKTSKGVYGDTGLQLAAYRFAEYGIVQQNVRVSYGSRHHRMDGDDTYAVDSSGVATGPHRSLLPDGIQGGLVVHLTADGYSVIPVGCGQEQLDGFLCAMGVHQHCRTARKLIGTPLRPVDHSGDDLQLVKAWLHQRVFTLATTTNAAHKAASQQLLYEWPTGVPTLGKNTHTADQLHQIEQALDRVEAAHGVPFGDTKPTPNTKGQAA